MKTCARAEATRWLWTCALLRSGTLVAATVMLSICVYQMKIRCLWRTTDTSRGDSRANGEKDGQNGQLTRRMTWGRKSWNGVVATVQLFAFQKTWTGSARCQKQLLVAGSRKLVTNKINGHWSDFCHCDNTKAQLCVSLWQHQRKIIVTTPKQQVCVCMISTCAHLWNKNATWKLTGFFVVNCRFDDLELAFNFIFARGDLFCKEFIKHARVVR